MDRGAWWATVHGCKELDTTEQLTLTALKEKIACRFSLSLLGHHFLACSGVWQYHFLFSFLQKCRELRKLLSLTLINKFMFIMRLVFPVGSCITDFFFHWAFQNLALFFPLQDQPYYLIPWTAMQWVFLFKNSLYSIQWFHLPVILSKWREAAEAGYRVLHVWIWVFRDF